MKHQQGYLSFVSVILIVIIGFIGMSVAYMESSSATATSNQAASLQALYLAEAGLEHATRELLLPTVASRYSCNGGGSSNLASTALTNTVGAGSYSVNSGGAPTYPTITTLNGALNSSDTTITVSSTSGYDNQGRIMIDRELINYYGKTSTTFTGAVRGVDGTTAVSHASGAAVGQYECKLVSQGGVPAVTGTPRGLRKIQDYLQLQETWAVGDTVNNNYSLIRWNKAGSEVTWSDGSDNSGKKDLKGISALSYSDIWAVGASAEFIHWDGSDWSKTTVTPNVTYNGVYCYASNDCHAVGDQKSNEEVILDYDGSSWSRATVGGNNSNKIDLKAVHCDAQTDCWAVGSRDGSTKVFYQCSGGPPCSWSGVDVSLANGLFTFNGVYCNSTSDCWAVGANDNFARYNGTSWSAYSTGLPSTNYRSIFCNNASDCWAVGDSNSSQDLFVHWNGTSWSRDSSNPSPVVNLRGVACAKTISSSASTQDCWAVGNRSGGNPQVFHYDGSSWTNFSTSGLSLPNVDLYGVAMIGPSSQPQAGWSEVFATN